MQTLTVHTVRNNKKVRKSAKDFRIFTGFPMVKDKSFYKNFFSMMVMLVLQNVIILSVNLADNVMVSAYSEDALSGVAAVNQLQFVLQQIIMGCGDALVSICSQYWGQKRTDPIRSVAKGAFFVGGSIGLLFFLAASLFPHQLVGLFTDAPAIIDEGVKYIRIIKYTYIVFALTNIGLAMLRSVETIRIAFFVSVSTLCINCGINYLLIGGNFGFPRLGVKGAAIGTLCARCVELIIVVCYIFLGDKKLGAKVSRLFQADKVLVFDYIRHCKFFIIVAALFGTSTALQTVILGHMNDAAIAANAASNSLFQMLKVASIGASSSAAVMIGKAVGLGDMKVIKSYTRTLQVIFLCIGALTSTLLFFLRVPVLSLYNNLSTEALEMANAFLLVLCFTGFGTAYEMPTLIGIVRGGGDSRFVFCNDLISIFGITLPLSFLAAFVFHWSPAVVVLCLNSDQVFKCGAAFIKANSYTWLRKLTRA